MGVIEPEAWKREGKIKKLLENQAKRTVIKARDDLIQSYTEELAVKYSPMQIKAALEALPVGERFPSLDVIKNEIRAHSESQRAPNDDRMKFQNEQKRFSALFEKWKNFLGEEKLGAYYAWWLKNYFGEIDASFAGFNTQSERFLKCAIFDLEDTCGKTPSRIKNTDHIVQTMRKKKAEIQKRLDKGVYKYKMTIKPGAKSPKDVSFKLPEWIRRDA